MNRMRGSIREEDWLQPVCCSAPTKIKSKQAEACSTGRGFDEPTICSRCCSDRDARRRARVWGRQAEHFRRVQHIYPNESERAANNDSLGPAVLGYCRWLGSNGSAGKHGQGPLLRLSDKWAKV